jgi:hypothetical protein
MMLRRLLAEIEASERPPTASDLAARLGVDRSAVLSMLGALRAQGRLAPEAGPAATPQGCAGAAACGAACPGPGRCPLVSDLGLGVLRAGRAGP